MNQKRFPKSRDCLTGTVGEIKRIVIRYYRDTIDPRKHGSKISMGFLGNENYTPSDMLTECAAKCGNHISVAQPVHRDKNVILIGCTDTRWNGFPRHIIPWSKQSRFRHR